MALLKGGTEAMIPGKIGGLLFFDYVGERHGRLGTIDNIKSSKGAITKQ